MAKDVQALSQKLEAPSEKLSMDDFTGFVDLVKEKLADGKLSFRDIFALTQALMKIITDFLATRSTNGGELDI